MNYSICIVTYHARFDKYFIPLIKKLVAVFPDKEILCIANGHPDKNLQIAYLDKFTAFLKKYSNVRYLTYDSHQPLAKCFNQLIILSQTEACLILNDDVMISELFRQELENKVLDKEFFSINGSWSHVYITKKLVAKIGWFDENLLGIGHEDSDYMCRMGIKGYTKIENVECLGINNYRAPATNPSFKEISEIIDNKYSLVNKEYINKKYSIATIDKKFTNSYIWKGIKFEFSVNINPDSITAYDIGLLDKNIKTKYATKPIFKFHKKILIRFQKLYFKIIYLLKK